MNWSDGRLLQMYLIYSYSYIYINASNLIYIISPLKLVHCAPPLFEILVRNRGVVFVWFGSVRDLRSVLGVSQECLRSVSGMSQE